MLTRGVDRYVQPKTDEDEPDRSPRFRPSFLACAPFGKRSKCKNDIFVWNCYAYASCHG